MFRSNFYTFPSLYKHSQFKSVDDVFENFKTLEGEIKSMSNNLFKTFISENPRNLIVEETDDLYVVEVDLPGAKKDEIKVSFEDQKIIIEAPRYTQHTNKKTDRVISVSTLDVDDIDCDKCLATYTNGILVITLVKSEKSKPISIKVK